MSGNLRGLSLVLSSASFVFLSSSAYSQTAGPCFFDVQRAGAPCVCLTEEQQDVYRLNESAVLCDPRKGDQQLSRLSPNPANPVNPVDPVDPTDPPPGNRQKGNNGIGNGLQDAPGNSDVTNGDAADGDDSGGAGPAGADGTAANGDPAGAGNNGNGGNRGNSGRS